MDQMTLNDPMYYLYLYTPFKWNLGGHWVVNRYDVGMNTWAPLFSSVVESSLWDEPLHVRVVFLTMMALKDADHVVRKNEYQLRRAANVEEAQVLEALKILGKPDRKRPDQEHEGRRIQKVEEGWLIINGDKYQKQMRRVSKAAWQKRYRASKRTKGVSRREMNYVKACENGEPQ